MTTEHPEAAVLAREIRDQRLYVEQCRRILDLAERELARLLAEAGRRPPDGSDQPSIFDPDHPKLF